MLYLEGDDVQSGAVFDQGELTRATINNATLTLIQTIKSHTSATQATVIAEADETQQVLSAAIAADGASTRYVSFISAHLTFKLIDVQSRG